VGRNQMLEGSKTPLVGQNIRGVASSSVALPTESDGSANIYKVWDGGPVDFSKKTAGGVRPRNTNTAFLHGVGQWRQ